MKKFSQIINSSIITMGLMGAAHAEGNWTGFYAGVDAGYAINSIQLKSQQLGFSNPSDACNTSATFSTAAPGVQVGYLHPLPDNYFTGIEANISINTNQTETLNCSSNVSSIVYDRFTFRNQLQTTVKGRAGRAFNWYEKVILPYLTAGGSVANVGLTYKNEGGDYYSTNATQAGWLLGAGVEWPFKPHWSLRAEYYYVNYGDAVNLNLPTVYGLNDPNGKAQVDLSSNNFFISLNYWV